MDPATMTLVLRGGTGAARAVGLIEDGVATALQEVRDELRALVEAPLHEAFSRLSDAQLTADPALRAQFLDEARAKLSDVGARPSVAPAVRARALTMLSVVWSWRGESLLAEQAWREAFALQRADLEYWSDEQQLDTAFPQRSFLDRLGVRNDPLPPSYHRTQPAIKATAALEVLADELALELDEATVKLFEDVHAGSFG